MPVQLCAECYLQSYCRRLMSRVVTREELTTAFITDVRAFMQSIDLSRDGWKQFLIDGYQNYAGRIVDADGREMMLDTSVFDLASIRYWFRDMCRLLPDAAKPRLKAVAIPRFIVTASILRALYPVQASLWGVTIANDDETRMPPVPVREAGCPYPHFRIG